MSDNKRIEELINELSRITECSIVATKNKLNRSYKIDGGDMEIALLLADTLNSVIRKLSLDSAAMLCIYTHELINTFRKEAEKKIDEKIARRRGEKANENAQG